MKKNKYSILFYLLFLLGGCYSSKTGKFRSSNGAFLKIKNDSTYEYFFREGWHQYISTGKWKKNDNGVLLLNSFYNTSSVPIQVAERIRGGLGDKKEIIVNFNERSDTSFLRELNFEISINESIKRQGSIEKILIPNVAAVKTIRLSIERKFDGIPYLLNSSLSTMTYSVTNPEANSFEIFLPNIRDDFYKENWNERAFILRKDRIIDRNANRIFFSYSATPK
jgi:hypothetical protein